MRSKGCRKEASERWEANNKSKRVAIVRACRLKRDYGINEAEYGLMLEMGDGVCWICKRPPEKNRAIGNFGDNPAVLMRERYLKATF